MLYREYIQDSGFGGFSDISGNGDNYTGTYWDKGEENGSYQLGFRD